jgi:hypothetical protein
MYRPVTPYITQGATKDDKRPRFAPAVMSARERVIRVADKETKLKLTEADGGEAFICVIPV